MTKATKTPAVSWVTEPRRKAIEVLTNMAAEASDWHWSFGDLMLVLIPIGKSDNDQPVRFLDSDDKGKRYPTLKAAYGALKRRTGIVVNYDLALTLRSTAAAWPKADRPDPSVMSIYACQRLNGRRADTGKAGLAEMADWIDETIKADGRVTVKAAEQRASDTNTSVVEDVQKPPKGKPKGKPETLKPFTGPTAWADYLSALQALRKRQPRSALPDDATGDDLVAVAADIASIVPSKVLTDVPN